MVERNSSDDKLASLRIDRGRRPERESSWARWWILLGVAAFALLALWTLVWREPAAAEVEVYRVRSETAAGSSEPVVLNAAGYIVPHHKIEVASKVGGRVAWIGVEKGDRVTREQVLVRLEDAEFRARVQQSQGRLAALEARLSELEAGSRPEEIQLAEANLQEAKAELTKAQLDLNRAQELAAAGVFARQELDDARARFQAQAARVDSLERAHRLRVLGPRKEEIAAVRGQVREALGELDYAQTLLDATVIRAPVTGTILERNVEVGEFVTTSFVGERGAKGYVVSLADLNDLQVELDISQDDFSKLSMGQPAVVTTDAFRDRPYKGEIVEMSPEADRQKATVQVKVQILEPDEFLRPEMNANVGFLAPASSGEEAPRRATVTIPPSAVRNGAVYLLVNGRAVSQPVEVGRTTARGAEILAGLSGGEDVIVSPPEDLADGDPVRRKGA